MYIIFSMSKASGFLAFFKGWGRSSFPTKLNINYTYSQKYTYILFDYCNVPRWGHKENRTSRL